MTTVMSIGHVRGGRLVEQFRQAPARREIGDELEPIGGRPIEAAQVDVRRVADGGEARDALAERGHESGMFDELRREIEKLDLVSGFGVDAVGPGAEAIDGRRDRGVYGWEHSDHRCNGPSRPIRSGRGYGKPKQPSQLANSTGSDRERRA